MSTFPHDKRRKKETVAFNFSRQSRLSADLAQVIDSVQIQKANYLFWEMYDTSHKPAILLRWKDMTTMHGKTDWSKPQHKSEVCKRKTERKIQGDREELRGREKKNK